MGSHAAVATKERHDTGCTSEDCCAGFVSSAFLLDICIMVSLCLAACTQGLHLLCSPQVLHQLDDCLEEAGIDRRHVTEVSLVVLLHMCLRYENDMPSIA